MEIKKVIQKKFNRRKGGVNVAGAVNAVVAGSVNETSSKTSVSSRQRIVQKNGVTVVNETETEGRESG